MKPLYLSWILALGLLFPDPSTAQVIPDRTLEQNSTVTSPSNNSLVIDGGTIRGGNLFHSFEQFSVPANTQALFNNSVSIDRIFSRVTGLSPSAIDGVIRANGSADLFLLNPNGILFGPNASLEIGGSFLATTAEGIEFADGTLFNATNPQASPLLTLSVPTHLHMGRNPAAITVEGLGHNREANPNIGNIEGEAVERLRVQPNQSLALVGGHLRFNGGTVTAEGGRVDLVAGGNGAIRLDIDDNQLILTPVSLTTPGNISLVQLSAVDTSGSGGGTIQAYGRNISLTESSLFLSLTAGNEPGGQLVVTGTESVTLTGEAAGKLIPSVILSETLGVGSASDITVTAPQINLTDGGQISASSFESGLGGNITLTAPGSLNIVGTSQAGFPSTVTASTFRFGQGGNISINAGQIQLQEGTIATRTIMGDGDRAAGDIAIAARNIMLQQGGQIATSTRGRGNAGNVAIDATEAITIAVGKPGNPSGIFSQVTSLRTSESAPVILATGNGGDLRIATRWLTLQNGAQISAATLGGGRGGNITVDAWEQLDISGSSPDGEIPSAIVVTTQGEQPAGGLTLLARQLQLSDGAQVTAATRGAGDGGTVRITASESIVLRGFSQDRPTRITVRTEGLGNAGSLLMGTERLIVENGAEINVNGIRTDDDGNLILDESLGGAGNIIITAPEVRLNRGQILANTTSGTQGNIFINSEDLRLRQESQIATNAVGESTGGNIDITTDLLTALENSDISANAEQNFGGRTLVTAQGVYGTEFRDRATDESDITATSALGPQFSGVVQLNLPDIDPAQDVAGRTAENPLPKPVEDACGIKPSLEPGDGRLTLGQAGIPHTPEQVLDDRDIDVPFIEPVPVVTAASAKPPKPESAAPRSARLPLLAANGWVTNEQGEVFLTAYAQHPTPHSPLTPDSECFSSSQHE
ncbi:S-layer family protein [Roseofilum casamattae]|uniref:S-layer family protein n=1 Tax=Roseofilum casamattae BLCC-M143 TaxID=3022442 RepID=A0ABT7C1Z0_9CYAN|nr:S-layer family protein [Roseofilum casamattae]MDJ1185471.1 S-layer family protein [Roseofilum casamattae BLCC-M143]